MASYTPNTIEQQQEMLTEIGINTAQELFAGIPFRSALE